MSVSLAILILYIIALFGISWFAKKRRAGKAVDVALAGRRVSAPLFVFPETGLNDNLSGVERRVHFSLLDLDEREVEVVQSLAKWKRMALGKYGI